MRGPHPCWLIAVTAALWLGCLNAAAAQVQVGLPGCSDDVSLNAWREAVSFETRGREVRAHLYRPLGDANGRGIVMLHGGTGFEMNAILFDAHALQLASRGYWVILPAYFDAARPDDSRRTVTARAWRRAALDAARYLSARPGVDFGSVALWGYSRGGGVAVGAGMEREAPVSAVIAVAAGGQAGDDPRPNVPVLLLHARSDEAVPVSATRSLAQDLSEAGAKVTVRPLDFDGHQYDLPTWCAVMAHTRAFLDEVIEAGDGPA